MKEKIINTRVTEELYKKISAKAKKNKTTVSTLLRALLEDSLDIYTDISTIIDQKIKDLLSEEKIVGYQDILVAKVQECSICNTKIGVDDKAYLVITDKGIKHSTIICNKCISSK